MKREIKFRFWIEKISRMANWETAKKECDRLSLLTMDGWIPLQFTGKVDCNGDDIYDGDIIRFDPREWGDNETNIHKVYWDDISAEWSFGGGSTSDMEWRTIIGNIYENPELIKS